MTTETTVTTGGRPADEDLALGLGEALELAAVTIISWMDEHVTVNVHERGDGGGRYFAAEYIVDGETVAIGFDRADRYEAQALALREGRKWVLREAFPATGAILSTHGDLLLRLT